MHIIRFEDYQGQIHWGARQGESVRLIEGDLLGEYRVTETEAQVARLLAPLDPAAILCVGLNYRQHAIETNAPVPQYPILFMKTPSSVQHPEEPIVLPRVLVSEEVDYECELAVVIGKTCKNATRENALSYVLGYTAANDVSARDWQIKRGGSQWGRGKTFDTFCPLGPALVTADEITNPNSLYIKTELNGELVQNWNTEDMIFDVPALIEFLSADTTLVPGTVILTGTPQGVGMARTPQLWMKAGDVITIEIETIGRLTNPVQ